MKNNVIVSLADANYFELINELIDSIQRFEKSKETAVCVLDAGLTEDQKSILSKKVDEIKSAEWDIKVPSFKVMGKEWLKSQVSRAFLPKYFPGYRKYLWIDADAWVNKWETIELYFKGSDNNKLAISTSADRSYGRVLRAEWLIRSIAVIKSQNYKSVRKIKGRGNSSIFKIEMKSGELYAGKLYPDPTFDDRNRLSKETKAYKFLHSNGTKNVLITLCFETNKLGSYI